MIIREIPKNKKTIIEKNSCWVLNDNNFGLMMIVDYENKLMKQIDSYALDYYGEG